MIDIQVNKKCIIDQVIRVTCDRTTTDLRACDPCTPFVSLSHKLRPKNHDISPTAVIHLRPTSDWPVMFYDWLATDIWPGRDRLELPVSLGKSLHEMEISRVTCDRFTTAPNNIRGNWVTYNQSAKTCDQGRIQLQVGSFASEINKFHDRFRRLKVIVELVDFNGE